MASSGESSVARLITRAGMQQVPTGRLELLQLRRFIGPELCERLVGLIDGNRRPSTIADDNGDSAFRTSETCDLPQTDAAVVAMETALTELSGIDPAHGEPIQGQRYALGQEFKAHTDYFEPGGLDYDRYCSLAGQRSWTFMVYLNHVEAGGGTRFKSISKTINPEQGKLLCWNNRRSDGSVNPHTMHHGMKVRRGTKYIITKWYRERPWN
ncbi:prolyl hydroxylase family protein [Pseudopontixanthobacter vadosimaris]|uniref:prolyl hydroxylase family protein n=1 Tax=Pseudopontixanthobacter vadosimaris TaxID=2726450 RepID=UPI0014761847|nr:2OG-Fe(II) oxygenase [Pseudopontixanthobacter vadosimaris]